MNPAGPTEDQTHVENDFAEEYPGADPLAAETVVDLVRTGERLDAEFSRRLRAEASISLRAFALLATIDGLGGRATSSEIATHIPITTAAITSVVDTCEKRGWIERVPDPEDRRKIQIHTTDEARSLLDRLLPGVHQVETAIAASLNPADHAKLRKLLDKVQAGLTEAEAQDPALPAAVRNRPPRLDADRL